MGIHNIEINFSFNSPLEQFEIFIVQPFIIMGIDLSITNVTFICSILVLVIIIHTQIFLYSIYLIPTYIQYITELFYYFIITTIKQQLGIKGMVYFPIIAYLSIFSLTSNSYGLVPFGFTLTGHIIITFSIALTFNLAFLLRTIYNNKLYVYRLFIPKGVPMLLLPLILVIEIMSYSLRTLSLSIRLFANMMAGHALPYTLSSSTSTFFVNKFIIITSFIFISVILVSILEIAICFIQAYVFTLLITIYLNDSFTKLYYSKKV